MKSDADYMQMALDLAAKGAGRTSPNPLVGAVVVAGDTVVGEGWHQRYGGPHAEVHAIDAAGEKAVGATIYVTLEPCNHHGKTPPCTEKILRAGIRRVVIAMTDPNPVAAGGIARLEAAGVSVTTGVLEEAARKLNGPFLKMVQTGLPYVVLKCAMTLDGCIATRTGDSKWITGPETRQWAHRHLRQRLDAILVGSGTVNADDPSLTCRLPEGDGRDPVRIILSRMLSLDENARVLRQNSDSGTVLVCGPGVEEHRKQRFTALGAEILVAPLAADGGIDLVALLPLLAARGIQSLLIEGGGRVAGAALRAGIVDRAAFFYAPKVLGGDDGTPALRGAGPLRMADAVQLQDMTITPFETDFLVEGRPVTA